MGLGHDDMSKQATEDWTRISSAKVWQIKCACKLSAIVAGAWNDISSIVSA